MDHHWQRQQQSQLTWTVHNESAATTTVTTTHAIYQAQPGVQPPSVHATNQMHHARLQQQLTQRPVRASPNLKRKVVDAEQQSPAHQTSTSQPPRKKSKRRKEERPTQCDPGSAPGNDLEYTTLEQKFRQLQLKDEKSKDQEAYIDLQRRQAGAERSKSGSSGETNAIDTLTTTFTTTSRVDTAAILFRQDLSPEAGHHRRQAFARGEYAVRSLDQRIQETFTALNPCPAGRQWVPVSDGYLCVGGTHFIPDREIDRLLDGATSRPQIERRNHPMYLHSEAGYIIEDVSTGYHPLKRPPEQLSREAKAWVVYECAKRRKPIVEAEVRARGRVHEVQRERLLKS